MLHTPSNHHHLSRVCGHGHIKKFWLMQTQKESEGKSSIKRERESRGSALVASHQRSVSGFGDHCALRNDSMSPARINEDRFSIRDPSSSNQKLFDSSYQALSVPGCIAASMEAPVDTNYRENPDMLTSKTDEGVRVKEVLHSKQSPIQVIQGEALCLKRTPISEDLCSLTVFCEENRIKAIDIQSSDGNTSSPRQKSPESRNRYQNSILFEEGKGIEAVGSIDADSCGGNVALQGHLNIDTRNKCLDHLEFDEEEHGKAVATNSSTVIASSPPYRKLDGRIKGLNHIETAERKCLEDVGMRSCTSVVMSPSHRKLHNRQRGLDHLVFDEEKCGENLPERDLSSPKVCTLCGATKTPMWRSGPQGPKSLCNACGIRYKKYRAFSGHGGESSDLAVLNPSSPPPTKGLAVKKRKQNVGALLPDEPSQPHKKSKWQQLVLKRDQADLLRDIPSAWKVSSGPASLKKIYGCMPSRLKNLGPMEDHLTVKRVFAKDEEEAAVLLMDLSCGLAF